jgi:hypothetical protein
VRGLEARDQVGVGAGGLLHGRLLTRSVDP